MTNETPPEHPHIVAIVPVGSIDGAKSRLGEVLDAEERRDLALSLAERTIRATVTTPGIDETFVVTPDDEVRDLALRVGARPLRQRSRGLNDGLREARDEAIAAGARAVLDPADRHARRSARICWRRSSSIADEGDGPLVAIVPDRHGRGTNALLLRAARTSSSSASAATASAAHVAAARGGRRAGRVELDGPLTLDIDTPDDLLLAQTETPEAVGG